jgi:hypothetical protein
MRIDESYSENARRLFRTVTALGAELRRQGALEPERGRKVDLIDLAYAAIAAADAYSMTSKAEGELV